MSSRGHGLAPGARPGRLFVAGCQRSGTTAFTDYLNVHPEILVSQERYKFVPPREVGPGLFTLERLLDHRPGETDAWREDLTRRIVAGKAPGRLRWIGDKNPSYVRRLGLLADNNQGARFLVLHRPLDEVAESFEARASDRGDHWPSENGFEKAIEVWNAALEHTRSFVAARGSDSLRIVDYRRFAADPGALAPLLSDFLEIDLDGAVTAAWAARSRDFTSTRRLKRSLSTTQQGLIREGKDLALEAWALDYIERQA